VPAAVVEQEDEVKVWMCCLQAVNAVFQLWHHVVTSPVAFIVCSEVEEFDGRGLDEILHSNHPIVNITCLMDFASSKQKCFGRVRLPFFASFGQTCGRPCHDFPHQKPPQLLAFFGGVSLVWWHGSRWLFVFLSQDLLCH
jgi:hypothetical protein